MRAIGKALTLLTAALAVAALGTASAPAVSLPLNVVTNTNDSGPGSLRAAIEFANANPGPDTISFAIPTADAGFNGQWFTIRPLSQLLALTNAGTTIDGSTQAAASGDTNSAGPEIELRGDLAPGASGLNAYPSAADSRIEGLAVNSFSGGAVSVQGARNVVADNYVGTDPTGAIIGNVGHGIQVCCGSEDSRIVDNLVRGNRPGMVIQGATRTVVQGNRVELSGPQPAPPGCGQGGGIFVSGTDNLVGGPDPGDRNVVSLNGNGGILLQGGSGTVVQGNYVGTDPTGTTAAGNRCVGIVLEGSITTNARIVDNLVSGNEQFGIGVGRGDGTVVAGNRVGTTADGSAALGNAAGGIIVVSSNTTVGGAGAGDGNVISGNGGGGVQVCGFPTCTASGITVQGNRIGTNAAGTAAVRNFSGVVLFNTTASAITGNLISGGGDGINLKPGTSGISVRGNRIGTTADGMSALGNLFGIQVGGTNNTIGGPTAADRNVIAGATFVGVALNTGATGNTVQGNYIGTNAAGTAALPNRTGVGVSASGNSVTGNLISGNSSFGVEIRTGSSAVLVQRNYIGTDADGSALIGNFGGIWEAGSGGSRIIDNLIAGSTVKPGITLSSGNNILQGNRVSRNAAQGIWISSTGSMIGGTGAQEGNIVSGNGGPGIQVAGGAQTTIQGNLIDTNANSGILIGGTASDGNSVRENTIAFNSRAGVLVLSGVRNTVSRNSIFSNGWLGIDLAPQFGVTANDPGDADTGPNELMNFPVLTTVAATPGRLVVVGTIDTPNPDTVVLEFFANAVGDPSGYGEGATFLGTATPNANGKFVATLPPVPPGTIMTATATDAAGNTSEFAKNVVAHGPGSP